MNIAVIDAPCGTGKTRWAIQEINEHPERNYVICTPLLTEIERFQHECGGRGVATPNNFDCSKIEDFNTKLDEGRTIAVTHVTFLNATAETIDLIRRGKYHLILDESLDMVVEFNKTGIVASDAKQALVKEDISLLFNEGFVSVDPTTRRVNWLKQSYQGKFAAVEQMAKSGRLYFVRGEMFVCVFPPEIFSAFESVTVLTYMFGGCHMKAYFQVHNISYTLASVVEKDQGRYEIVEWSSSTEQAFKEQLKDLVTVLDNPRMNFQKIFSKKWYQNRCTKADTEALKKNMTNFFHYMCKASATKDEIMWTCPKDFEKRFEGSRYTSAKKIEPQSEDHAAFLDELKRELGEEDFIEQLSCFVPCNSRGTNRYRYRWALAYLCDIHYNGMLNGYFLDGNEQRRQMGLPEIELDEDLFSLSCFIQWMFRSRIRDGKPIVVYIPSKRIRELFLNWLYDGEYKSKIKKSVLRSR